MSDDPLITENLRQARTNARLRSEIALHESQIKLSESFGAGFSPYPDLINPLSQFYDGTNPIYPLYPSRFDRRIGTNGIWVSESQLDLIRLYSRYLYDTSPIAKGIVRGKRNYIFGTGFSYTVEAKKGERVAKPLIEQAQRLLDEFLECNEWDLRESETYTRCQRDGENFFRLFPSDDDDCCADLRNVEPEQVRSPNDLPEWLLGTKSRQDDREKIEAYSITYSGTLEDAEEVDTAEVQHTKVNTDLAVVRGLTCFFTTQELISGAQKLLRATVEGESVRQAIAYIVEHQLASQSTVTGNLAAITDFNQPVPSMVTGKTIPVEKVTPGSVHEMPEARQVKPPPISDTTNATNSLAAAYQALAVCYQVPQWMVSGDTGNTNFAASLTAESPLVKDTLVEQKFYSNQFIKLFKKALQIAENQGRLPEGTVKKLQIFAECPSPAVRDAAKETDQNKVLSDSGILSDKTWSEREELDFEQERANGAKKIEPAAAKGAPSTDPSAVYSSQTEGSK